MKQSQLTEQQWSQWAGLCRHSGQPLPLRALVTTPTRIRLWDDLRLSEQAILTILRLSALPGFLVILEGACLSQADAITEVRRLSAAGRGIIHAEGRVLRQATDLARREVFYSLRAQGVPADRAVLSVVCPTSILEEGG